MSKNPVPVFPVFPNANPQQLKTKIKILTTLYVESNVPTIADALVNHICALLAHASCTESSEQRCLYRTLEMHWRCVAWNARH